MQDFIERYFAFGFPVFFVCMWLGVTLLLGLFSGWYRLARLYPDRPDLALVKLRMLSGQLGSMSMRGALNLDGCGSGLRIMIFRLLGPLCRDIFVPWSEVQAQVEKRFFFDVMVVRLGDPVVSKLVISVDAARQIEAAVPLAWKGGSSGPGSRAVAGPLPAPETNQQALLGALKRFALTAVLGSAFFLACRQFMWGGEFPAAICIGLPCFVGAVNALIQYSTRARSGSGL